jgi:hypothetical protein
MPVLEAVFIRGAKKPADDDFNSRTALWSGVSVPMPTLFWASTVITPANKAAKRVIFLNIL